jgi:hypothetical protein
LRAVPRSLERTVPALRAAVATVAIVAVVAVVAGCGFTVEQPDLFLLTRTGQGRTLTLLVNDSGTIRCDGHPAKAISDRLLVQARDLADNLAGDAKSKLQIATIADSVYFYTVKLQDGTITFPDTAAGSHHELAQAELFALQAAQGPCGLG